MQKCFLTAARSKDGSDLFVLCITLKPLSTELKSDLVLSNSNGLSEILRDICTSTYHIA